MIHVKLEQQPAREDIEVLIRYAQPDRRVSRMAAYAKALDGAVRCSMDGATLWVAAADILYVESVDKKTFVYTGDAVYRTEMRLYQLLERLGGAGLVQVSKFCIVNLYHLESVKTLANSRMEGRLSNGENITISRKYIPEIKQKLQER